ncbi:MAG: hypothetical protein QUT30_00265 [Acidobacteriota bacterium]|nr:hypothetical protein [Acidobacteriota bacterium]
MAIVSKNCRKVLTQKGICFIPPQTNTVCPIGNLVVVVDVVVVGI